MATDFTKIFDLLKIQPTIENVISALFFLNERISNELKNVCDKVEKLESKISGNGFVREKDIEELLEQKADSSDISVLKKDIDYMSKNIETLKGSISKLERDIERLTHDINSVTQMYKLYGPEKFKEIENRLHDIENKTVETKAKTNAFGEQYGLLFSLILLALGTIINIILTLLKK